MLRTRIVICLSFLLILSSAAESTPTYEDFSGDIQPAYHSRHKTARGNLFPQTRPATGRRVFIFNPRTHAWAAYDEDGIRVRVGRGSGGRAYCRDVGRSCKTIVGNFAVLSKGDAYCKSRVYPIDTEGGAPMPYCMKFSEKGYAIHGANSVPKYNASHGCIRVPTNDARWLNSRFVEIGTRVVVLPY